MLGILSNIVDVPKLVRKNIEKIYMECVKKYGESGDMMSITIGSVGGQVKAYIIKNGAALKELTDDEIEKLLKE